MNLIRFPNADDLSAIYSEWPKGVRGRSHMLAMVRQARTEELFDGLAEAKLREWAEEFPELVSREFQLTGGLL
ncbi:MAG TPA: hypothetical protein VFT89_07185 [Rhizobiaceae bacterium]|nr:hypothetical protein [Rhizobiaceae bacterium]